jgi:HprK-related kinase A
MTRRASTLRYTIGPFATRLTSYIPDLSERLFWFYGDTETFADDRYVHFNIQIRAGSLVRRWTAPQAVFQSEDQTPFQPFPRDHAFPLLEWGLNWCIAHRAHQFLMLHAGVVERSGQALILPATPGSGKSTLTTALIHRGWRLLSDEFGLVDNGGERIHPLPRAIPLKNRSIDVIRAFAPHAALGPVFPRTRKGDVAHVRPPLDALLRQHETASPGWIMFPKYVPRQAVRISPLEKSLAFTRLAQNSFNYRLLGAAGFQALRRMVQHCPCYAVEYGDLREVVAAIDTMMTPGTR